MDKINLKTTLVIDNPENGVACITDMRTPGIEYWITFDSKCFEAWFRDSYDIEDFEEAEQDHDSIIEYLKSGGQYKITKEMFNKVSATLHKFIPNPDAELMVKKQIPSRLAYEMDMIHRHRRSTEIIANGMLEAIESLR